MRMSLWLVSSLYFVPVGIASVLWLRIASKFHRGEPQNAWVRNAFSGTSLMGGGKGCHVWRYGDKVQTFDKLTALRRKCCCNIRREQQQIRCSPHSSSPLPTFPPSRLQRHHIKQKPYATHALIDLWSQTRMYTLSPNGVRLQISEY